MPEAKKVSVENAEQYNWGENNDGWHLLKNENLSVIEERMEAHTSEKLHFHKSAQQLFYILAGEAYFKSGDGIIHLQPGEAIHVLPGVAHQISNAGAADLRFLVISSPKSHGDRIDV